MSGKHPFHPDSVIGAYVEDLLSVPEDLDPYLDPEPEPRLPDRETAPASSGPPAVKLAERPALRMNLIGPALRYASRQPQATEPDNSQPEQDKNSERMEPKPEQSPADTPTEVPLQKVATSPEAWSPATGQDPASAPVAPAAEQAQAWEQGRPPWAQKGFECLIFRVAGLQLAVPLVLLGAIHRLDSELTPLFGRPDWFMGLYPEGDQNIKVADTARWVMPERYRQAGADRYEFVIRLDNSQWGLACHEVAQSFTVQPEDVKWRTANSRRQWLAGTIREQMCALLDVSRLAAMLAEAEQGRALDMNR